MHEVHSPQETIHTWKSFLIHMASICLGLLLALVLEQSVESMHRRHESDTLRKDLHAESRQILADAQRTEVAHNYELDWLKRRIAQVQSAIWGHQPLESASPNQMPGWASPDIPIWRSAKAASRTSLLTKGEVNAYAEVEYVLAHLETSLDARTKAEDAVRSFNREFAAAANGSMDLSKVSAEDQRRYLGLLSGASVAFDTYVYWLRTLIGAEQAVIAGKTSLGDIYASEAKLIRSRDPM
jgi:hypothetical protein